MNFSFLPSGPSFGNSFENLFGGHQKSYSSFGPFGFDDFGSNDQTLPSAKGLRADDSSPCDFFAATRQSTDITNFSENTPIDVSNFFDMQGCPQPSSNFSLVDSINWDSHYHVPDGQFLQQQHYPQVKKEIYSEAKSLKEEFNESEEMEEAEAKEDIKEWDDEESEKLIKLAEQYKSDWKKIAKLYTNKRYTPVFLKAKHKEAMAASAQKRVKFTHKEDIMIAFYFEKHGSNWTKMATFFQNRTGIMLKNRYYSFIRKKDLLADLLKESKEYEASDKGFSDLERNADSENQAFENINQTHAKDAENLATSPEKVTNDYQKEIRLLNMKIKSLKALCAATHKELNGMKQSSI